MSEVGERLAAAMNDRGVDQPALAGAVGVTQGAISMILTGKTLRSRFLPEIADQLDVPLSWLNGEGDDAVPPRGTRERTAALTSTQRRYLDLLQQASPQQQTAVLSFLQPNSTASEAELDVERAVELLDLVPVSSVDLAYGMGGTFADVQINVDILRFPRQWLEAVTNAAPANLTWARGRGDSMSPTIEDGDLVLIDRSDRSVRDQDAIWAFTIGDIAMMKRLRVRGEQVTILSDNSRVPPDHAHPSEMNVVGKVSHIIKRL